MKHKQPIARPASQVSPPTEAPQEWETGQKRWDAKPRIKLPKAFKSEDGVLTVEAESDAHGAVDAALGSDIGEFQAYCLTNLANALGGSAKDDHTIEMNAALAMLNAIGPRDEFEAMLAVQMVAANHLALKTMTLTNNSANPINRQLNANLATKFSRTFVAQMEALNRHRRGGKQIVEHVHVNAGGQAVIAGTVNTGGRG